MNDTQLLSFSNLLIRHHHRRTCIQYINFREVVKIDFGLVDEKESEEQPIFVIVPRLLTLESSSGQYY
jgi:hypothetical protein